MTKQRWRREREHDSYREEQKISASSQALAPTLIGGVYTSLS
jgi:hypothetical protein